ncbi:hypothetical protein PH210_09255 [Paenibacillus sp. BSR1-1]|uniref:hypothetical protein n=1 Tax=Paenibacillus sp. BSR1-1 TaxID=3020845 RepID=UPI0025B106A1|nr:hypothetical protein [Paenibacillus sp. BSR1-1]MDN3016387.1 hypothetical protein [Paenibacillus sp. BSR1-1]
MTKAFSDTDVIDIVTRVNGQVDCRIHFQLTTDCIIEEGFTKITYTITNFLDSTSSIAYFMVDEQLFTFESGVNPGSIGKIHFKRNGSCEPAMGAVYIETDTQGFEFGNLSTAVIKKAVTPSE